MSAGRRVPEHGTLAAIKWHHAREERMCDVCRAFVEKLLTEEWLMSPRLRAMSPEERRRVIRDEKIGRSRTLWP
jgi:hypothetical protein